MLVQSSVEHFLQLLKLFRLVVAWGDVPIKIVLVENAHNVVKLDKGNFLGIESTEEHRWHMLLMSVSFTNGNNKLNKGVDKAV